MFFGCLGDYNNLKIKFIFKFILFNFNNAKIIENETAKIIYTSKCYQKKYETYNDTYEILHNIIDCVDEYGCWLDADDCYLANFGYDKIRLVDFEKKLGVILFFSEDINQLVLAGTIPFHNNGLLTIIQPQHQIWKFNKLSFRKFQIEKEEIKEDKGEFGFGGDWWKN